MTIQVSPAQHAADAVKFWATHILGIINASDGRLYGARVLVVHSDEPIEKRDAPDKEKTAEGLEKLIVLEWTLGEEDADFNKQARNRALRSYQNGRPSREDTGQGPNDAGQGPGAIITDEYDIVSVCGLGFTGNEPVATRIGERISYLRAQAAGNTKVAGSSDKEDGAN